MRLELESVHSIKQITLTSSKRLVAKRVDSKRGHVGLNLASSFSGWYDPGQVTQPL